MALMVKNLPVSVGDARDMGSIPASGRFPWSRKWQPAPSILAWNLPWTEQPEGL